MMKYQKTRGFTLVELMIVVAIIGILAAIAIPAFLRYIKSTKVAEAEGIMRKIADGSKAYFTSEQKWSDPGDGDQPWHVGDPAPGNPTSYGMPIPFDQYVFPGGGNFFNTTDGPGAGPNSVTAPDGGEKQIPYRALPGDVLYIATLNKLNLSFEDPLYFQYSYVPQGSGQFASAQITALADFDPVSGPAHQVFQQVSVNTNYEVFVGPPATYNEFH